MAEAPPESKKIKIDQEESNESGSKEMPVEVEIKDCFKDFKIDSADFLNDLEGREKCSKCMRSRKFYCYSCYIPLDSNKDKLPKIKLPINISIIKHPQETEGKSTACHGSIIAPESIKIYNFPGVPKIEDPKKAILIFPSQEAEDAVDFMKRTYKENDGQFPYENIIFIDSTWNQTRKICDDPNIIDLHRVKINGFESLFWRYQKGKPDNFLATIEAVYHFTKIHHQVFISTDEKPYNGEYDNLLFFFKFMFNNIRKMQGSKPILAFKNRPYLQQQPNAKESNKK